MSTQYGLALNAPSKQSILPVVLNSGRVLGFYPIAETTFDGTETAFELSDCTVPVSSVTIDPIQGRSMTQYVAAVFPDPSPSKPWASADFVDGSTGYYRWYSLPTATWTLHFGNGALINGLVTNLDQSYTPAAPTTPPEAVTPDPMTWTASLDYAMLRGDCPFFDFNWINVFKAKSTNATPVRITVVSNPPPVSPSTVPPLKASVIGVPTATSNGPVFDTIRILRLGESILPDSYTFAFSVLDTTGAATPVTLTLTVK